MVTVDSKGRVVLPQHVRERLGITPGSEVEIREQDGRAVVEPEDDPASIVSDIERLIDGAVTDRKPPQIDEHDVLSRDHLAAIDRQASEPDQSDE